MEFDVTGLHQIDLLRALISEAKPKGYGVKIYEDSLDRGENVNSISDEEAAVFFADFNSGREPNLQIVDYYKGMPIKLDLHKKSNGQIVAASFGYDVSHGEFAYLKVLLTYFHIDDIIILDKFHSTQFKGDDSLKDSAEVIELNAFIEDAVSTPYKYGSYWKLDPLHPTYQSFKIEHTV